MLSTRASRLRLAALVVAAAAMTGSSPGTARAACASSTPAAQSFADDPFDGELGLAPEITTVDVSLGAACDLVVLPRLGDRSETAGLIVDEAVSTYIDVDGDPATGSPQWGGADRVVQVIGRNGADLPPALGSWTGTAFSFAAAVTLPVIGAGGFAATLDQLGIASPATLGLRVTSSWVGLRDTYDDFAPAPGSASFAFPVSFTTAAAPQPAGAIAPPAPAVNTAASRPRCTVPKVRRLPAAAARRKLDRAGCRSRVVRVGSRLRSGRVVSTRPAAGAVTGRIVVVRVAARGRHT
jgi:hypothetical protein